MWVNSVYGVYLRLYECIMYVCVYVSMNMNSVMLVYCLLLCVNFTFFACVLFINLCVLYRWRLWGGFSCVYACVVCV